MYQSLFHIATNVIVCKRPCSSYRVQYYDATMFARRPEGERQIMLILPDQISQVETVLAVSFTGNAVVMTDVRYVYSLKCR